jgi:hypothetical protein
MWGVTTQSVLSENILNAKRIVAPPPSDHGPIILRLLFYQKKQSAAPPRTKKPRIDWEKLDDQATTVEFRQIAMTEVKCLTDVGIPSAKDFSKAIVAAAESTCMEDDPAKFGWFADAHTTLLPLIEARNAASEAMKEAPSELNSETFKKAHQTLKKTTTTAKNRSEFKKSTTIMQMMRSKPCEAWDKMRNLQAGHNLHHKIGKVLHFSQDGVKDTND